MKKKWLTKIWRHSIRVPIFLGATVMFLGLVIIYLNDKWVGISAMATLLLALGAFLAIQQTLDIRKSEKRERLLNEIIEWATKVRKYINSLDIGGFNSERERSQAKWEYSTLKFGGKNIIISVEKETLGNTILGNLHKATKFFNDISWNSLGGSENKETRKSFDEVCENVIEEAIKIKTKDIS